MNSYRIIPDVAKPSPWKPPSEFGNEGCIILPIFIVISYLILSSILRVISNTGNRLDQIICYGTLIIIIIIMLIGGIDMIRDNIARKEKRKNWSKGCKTAILRIINRYREVTWYDELANHYHTSSDSIDLEMNSEQQAFSPNQPIISVEVDNYIYERLKDRNTALIFYLPESPTTFLLKEEI